jgi:cephalosporin hydroxylase
MNQSAMIQVDKEQLVQLFHQFYYDDARYNLGTWAKTFWFGVPTLKCPLDMWIYQEVIFKTKPDLIIECGTNQGGSALFFAHMLTLMGGDGRIITIDIEHLDGRPEHERITYLKGSSTSPEMLENVKQHIKPETRVMVVLDSDHSKAHVLEELKLYAPLVTVGLYLIVEDTNINGHPVRPDFGPGPMEAVDEFLKDNDHFQIDPGREKFHLTFNPRGYLGKVREKSSKEI